MSFLWKFTCSIVSAVTSRSVNVVRSIGALPGRYIHWETFLQSADSGASGPKLKLSDQEWKKQLTTEQYNVCRQKVTEMPFSGEYCDNHQTGLYICVCCGAELFSSKTKFESGSGWPSFCDVYTAQGENASASVGTKMDRSHGMVRNEVLCQNCDSHLGHVFDDGPAPTGQRYCINSVALKFVPHTDSTDGEK